MYLPSGTLTASLQGGGALIKSSLNPLSAQLGLIFEQGQQQYFKLLGFLWPTTSKEISHAWIWGWAIIFWVTYADILSVFPLTVKELQDLFDIFVLHRMRERDLLSCGYLVFPSFPCGSGCHLLMYGLTSLWKIGSYLVLVYISSALLTMCQNHATMYCLGQKLPFCGYGLVVWLEIRRALKSSLVFLPSALTSLPSLLSHFCFPFKRANLMFFSNFIFYFIIFLILMTYYLFLLYCVCVVFFFFM